MPDTMLGGTRFTTEMERKYRAMAEAAVRILRGGKYASKSLSYAGLPQVEVPKQDSGSVQPIIRGGEVTGAFVEITLWVPAPKPARRRR